jgi:hypothetical protein
MKKQFLALVMVLLTVSFMYFPASAKTTDEGSRTGLATTLTTKLSNQVRYFRYRGRIYRVRFRRYRPRRRYRRVRYYRYYRYRRYRRY